jgi:hypothetical protein
MRQDKEELAIYRDEINQMKALLFETIVLSYFGVRSVRSVRSGLCF